MGARIAIHTKSIPFVLHRPGTAATARHRLRATLLSLSLSLSLLLSPNFVANLRATKSAPFDFTLIRCRCRAVDEANLSPFTLAGRDRRGFHFPRSVPFLSRQVCFKVTTSLHPPARYTGILYRCCVSLRPPLIPLIPLVPCSLSLFSFPLLSSPLLSTTILSLVTQP